MKINNQQVENFCHILIFNSQNFHNSFFFGNFTTRLKRNSEIRNTKFSENWPLNFWPSNVTYTAAYLVGHGYTNRIIQIVPCKIDLRIMLQKRPFYL